MYLALVETVRLRREEAGLMIRPLLTCAVAMAGLSSLMVVAVWPETSWSYSAFGRVPYVSDAAPFCAGCHSSTDTAYHPELSAEAAQKQLFSEKHYQALEKGGRSLRAPSQQPAVHLLRMSFGSSSSEKRNAVFEARYGAALV